MEGLGPGMYGQDCARCGSDGEVEGFGGGGEVEGLVRDERGEFIDGGRGEGGGGSRGGGSGSGHGRGEEVGACGGAIV